MSPRTAHEVAGDDRGMKRSTRISIIAGVVVFLSLTSGVSFAAWTASSTKNATASAGAVAVSTSNSAGSATITALGPHTYTATNQTVTKPITVRNTGSVEASVSSIAITRTGTLPGGQVDVKFWVGASAACAPATPVVQTALSGGTVSLSSLNLNIPANSSALLCASTTFTGNMANQAGKATTGTFALNLSAGTNWNATDAVSASGRSFAQYIFKRLPPNPPTMVVCEDQKKKDKVDVSWTAPAGFTTPNGGYNVYYDGVFEINTTDLTIEIQDKSKGVYMDVTIRAVDSDGTESVDSETISIEPLNKDKGISCAR